jgi:hypothetical protein
MTSETPALGICLEESEYPFPVSFLPLSNDLQPLKMAYMDIPPGTEPNGRTAPEPMARPRLLPQVPSSPLTPPEVYAVLSRSGRPTR